MEEQVVCLTAHQVVTLQEVLSAPESLFLMIGCFNIVVKVVCKSDPEGENEEQELVLKN